jgi:KaiC/GvpD/RAD55 family RecA-like ATPase
MNQSTIRCWYDVFKDNNELVEIRILDPETRKTYSGYFTNIEDIVREVSRFDKCNIYFTLNVINPACYGREQKDKISTRPKSTTSDSDIIGRKWCLIDVDCEKPSDTNSTDEEKEEAKQVVNAIYKFLRDEGFEPPVICDSANGWHLLYKQAMKASPENTEIMKRFLQVLDLYFSTDKVKVDVSTFNNSRICKLYGTVSRKGSDTLERPQRESGFVRIPREVRVTKNEYFAKVASYLPQPEKKDRTNNYGETTFDLDAFLSKHSIAVDRIIEDRDYTKYILKTCPFNSSHSAPDSAVFKMRDGSFGFKCLHASDSHYTFRDFRTLFEPDAYSRERSYSPHRSFKPYRGERPQLELQENEATKGNVWQTFGEIEDEDRSKIVSIPSGITQLDAECCGFDKPSLNIWSGNNGSAKSTLLNQIAINAINQGFKVAIYSGELRGQRLKRWVVMQAAGKAHNRKSIYNSYDYYTPDSIKEHIVSWMSDKLYVYNTKYSHSMEQVCLEVETLVREKQIDMLIMDNLSCMDIAELDFGVNEQQKTAVKMLLRLTTKLGIATHLVVHPKKAEGFLRKNDVSGAKALTDLADSVFFCHRWNQDTQKAAKEFLPEPVFYDLNTCGTTNIVEVIKHREFGEAEGHIYKLYYEPESRRLKNSVAENIIYGWYEQPTQSIMSYGSTEFDIHIEDDMWKDTYNFDGDESPF